MISQFSFCHNVFKCSLLHRRQTAGGIGLTTVWEMPLNPFQHTIILKQTTEYILVKIQKSLSMKILFLLMNHKQFLIFSSIMIFFSPASGNFFSSVTKFFGSMQNSGFHGNETKRTLKFFFSQTRCLIFKSFCSNVPWMTRYQIPSSHFDK